MNQIPPFLCRVVARKFHGNDGWTAMSVRELSARSGLSRFKVQEISGFRKWDNVSVSDAEKFARACGVNLLQPGSHKKWLRQSSLVHIMKARQETRDALTRLLKTA